ncbi:MAG: O-antigen ligase family protein [Bacteroidales bacterium]|nr:O-antigen ligase family protein [Bacteroidales bacterium]
MLERYLKFPKGTHKFLFLFSSIVIAAGLPHGHIALSVGQIVLGANWLLEENPMIKVKRFVSRKSVLLIFSVYLVHLLGMLYSDNHDYGFHDLRIKLPLLGLPIIYGTSRSLSSKDLNYILHFFILTILVGSFISFVIYLGLTPVEVVDIRDITIFTSHIRFSIMVDFTAVLCLYYLINFHRKSRWLRIFYLGTFAWFSIFLYILNAYTGIIIYGAVLPVVYFYLIYKKGNKRILKFSFIGLTTIVLFLIAFMYYSFNRFNQRNELDKSNLDEYTINGNRYDHFSDLMHFENGNQTWIFICDEEMKREWNKRSNLEFDSVDLKNQPMRATLVRYLASLGYRRDSVGVWQLTEEDVRHIELGKANYIFTQKWSLYRMVYPILLNWENVKKAQDPNGSSFQQRIEYFKTGLHIIGRFPVFGTGTGDVGDEFSKQYNIDNSPLLEKYRFRAHNQILTFYIAFGIIGGTWICLAFLMAIYLERKNLSFISIIFYTIAILSFMNEDTLETHTGISYVMFFFSLLLYNSAKSLSNESNQQ